MRQWKAGRARVLLGAAGDAGGRAAVAGTRAQTAGARRHDGRGGQRVADGRDRAHRGQPAGARGRAVRSRARASGSCPTSTAARSAKDGNGYISRLTRDGKVDSLKFIAGGRGGVKLDAPKGLAIKGDTLWVADIDAARAFDKRSGKPIATVSLVGKAKFLNDAAVGPDGAIYFTDTGFGDDGKGGMGAPGARPRLPGRGPQGDRRARVQGQARPQRHHLGLGGLEVRDRALRRSHRSTAGPRGTRRRRWWPKGPGRWTASSRWATAASWSPAGPTRASSCSRATRSPSWSAGFPSPADIALDRERGRVAVPLLIGEPGRVRGPQAMSALSYLAVAAGAVLVGAAGAERRPARRAAAPSPPTANGSTSRRARTRSAPTWPTPSGRTRRRR